MSRNTSRACERRAKSAQRNHGGDRLGQSVHVGGAEPQVIRHYELLREVKRAFVSATEAILIRWRH